MQTCSDKQWQLVLLSCPRKYGNCITYSSTGCTAFYIGCIWSFPRPCFHRSSILLWGCFVCLIGGIQLDLTFRWERDCFEKVGDTAFYNMFVRFWSRCSCKVLKGWTCHTSYEPCTGGLSFRSSLFAMWGSGRFVRYLFVNLLAARGLIPRILWRGHGATSALALNDIKHVMYHAKEVAFKVCWKRSEFHFEHTVNQVWAIHSLLTFV